LPKSPGEAEPPVAEQLISSNALRQRRFREKQAASRHNASEALQAPLRNADADDLDIPPSLDRRPKESAS
jgi:hypothetical protein